MNYRKPIGKKLRFEVFKRDGFVCQYCGSHPPSSILEIDHIIPVSSGGDNVIDNLITSCFSCNRGKSNYSLKSVPKTILEKTKILKEKEDQLYAYNSIMDEKRERLEYQAFSVADKLFPRSSENGIRYDWLLSIKIFVDRLGFHETLESADIARGISRNSEYKVFKYFCGVCWNKIRRIENA